MPQIEFQGVSFCSDGKQVLDDVSIAVGQGEFLSIVGPSGSGKSTFLRLCCHLISPSAGRILLNGEDVMALEPTELRKKVAYCFQTPVLFGTTVEDNLRFPCRLRRQELDRERALALLARFRLGDDCLAHRVQTLSGGEKQRVALVRTLLFTPEVLLLDEATAALDAENAQIVEQAVDALNREGVTVLWVTHDDAQSRRYAARRLTIENGRVRSLEVLR